MAGPTPATNPTPSPGTLPSGAPAPDESVRVLLSIARSLALLFAILAGLLFLVFLAFGFLAVVQGRGPDDLLAAVYSLVSAAVNFVLWREIPPMEQLAGARQYGALRERLLIWGVLGLVFFVVVGVLLLVAWVRIELLTGPRPD